MPTATRKKHIALTPAELRLVQDYRALKPSERQVIVRLCRQFVAVQQAADEYVSTKGGTRCRRDVAWSPVDKKVRFGIGCW